MSNLRGPALKIFIEQMFEGIFTETTGRNLPRFFSPTNTNLSDLYWTYLLLTRAKFWEKVLLLLGWLFL